MKAILSNLQLEIAGREKTAIVVLEAGAGGTRALPLMAVITVEGVPGVVSEHSTTASGVPRVIAHCPVREGRIPSKMVGPGGDMTYEPRDDSKLEALVGKEVEVLLA